MEESLFKFIEDTIFKITGQKGLVYDTDFVKDLGLTSFDVMNIVCVFEDHFDHSIELENMLTAKGKTKELDEITSVCNLANIYFLRQKETKGLGDAVLRAKQFVGSDPFAILYGDDVIIGESSAIGEMCEAYEKYGKSVVGIKEVSDEAIVKYSSLKVTPLEENIFEVSDMIEKPSIYNKLSNYAVLGRCILEPDIFPILEKTPFGVGGELQLTDAMKAVANKKGMLGVVFSGERHDMGNKFGMLKANIDVGLTHPETKKELTEYIKKLAKEL